MQLGGRAIRLDGGAEFARSRHRVVTTVCYTKRLPSSAVIVGSMASTTALARPIYLSGIMPVAPGHDWIPARLQARLLVESSLPTNLTRGERRLAFARRLYDGELPEAALVAFADRTDCHGPRKPARQHCRACGWGWALRGHHSAPASQSTKSAESCEQEPSGGG